MIGTKSQVINSLFENIDKDHSLFKETLHQGAFILTVKLPRRFRAGHPGKGE